MIKADSENSLDTTFTGQPLFMVKLLQYRGLLKPGFRLFILLSMLFSSLLSTVYGQISCPLILQNELVNFIASPNSSTTTLWFNLHVNLNNNQLASNGDYLMFSGGSITFTGVNTSFGTSVALPNGEIIADATAGSPSTSFNAGTNTWVTRVPPGYSSPDLFISGAANTSGIGYTLSGGNNFTTLTGVLTANKLISSTWSYGLACYGVAFSNSNIGSVNAANNIPVSGFSAGTPTSQTGNLVAGGSGSGGSNYIGTLGLNYNFTSCVNTSPTAYAGPDQQLAAGITSTTLSGSGTGTGITYAWTKISGGGAAIANPSSAATSITGLAAGVYIFQLKVTDNSGFTATNNVTLTITGGTVLTIQGTTTNLTATDNDVGYNIPRSVPTVFSFLNNYMSSVANSGYVLQAGDESPGKTNDNLDGEIVSGNYLYWNGTGTNIQTHGLFTSYNINAVITYNYLYHVPMSIVMKGGTNTGGGAIAYNIINNPQYDGVNVKGMDNVNIFNNTFYNNGNLSVGFIDIYDNNSPVHSSTGTHIFNNIFYSTGQIINIQVETSDCLTGLQSDYNLFYCESGTPMFKIGGTSYTFSQWQALGYDMHSVVVNPNFNNFTDFIPAAPLSYGTNLGSAWQKGLTANAVWSTAAMPATANQGSAWQVGARVVSIIQTPAILPIAGNTGPISVSAYPNPYASEVNFNITSPVSGKGTLEIYDLSGSQVASIFIGDFMAGSAKTITYRMGATQRQLLIYILKIGNEIIRGKLLPRE